MKAAIALLILSFVFPATSSPVQASERLIAVDVSNLRQRQVRQIRQNPAVSWWAQFGDTLVLATGASTDPGSLGQSVRDLGVLAPGEALYVGQRLHPNEIAPGGGVRLLASGGVHTLLASQSESALDLNEGDHHKVEPLRRNFVYARQRKDETPGAAARPSAALAGLADSVDGQRWHDTVRDLAAFTTRYVGTAGLNGSRDYIAAEFQELGLSVSVLPFQVQGQTAHNVVGELRGMTDSLDMYIVCGHYDSISETPTTVAPGAEDNGSGAAGVIELARVFAANPPPVTIRFIAFSGEEIGLTGSEKYVDDLVAAGEASNVRGVINMDMIGYSGDNDLDVLLETNTNSDQVLNSLAEAAAIYTGLRVTTSFNPFGSDHVPFLRKNIPTVLTIQNDWDSYPDYHRSTDRLSNVRIDMGSEILKMNAAALGILMGVDAGGFLVSRVRYKSSTDDRLILDGRFASATSQVLVNGEPVGSTTTKAKFTTGPSTRRLIARDATLRTLVPKGVEVRIAVVDTATGAVTADFPFTR